MSRSCNSPGALSRGVLFGLILAPGALADTAVPSDFNGDGYSDLLIGVPGKVINDQGFNDNEQGAAFVAYSNGTRISFSGEQYWHQDTDNDGIDYADDNCRAASNPDQRDTDGDGIGNVCDADLNNDCIVNVLDLGPFRQLFFTDDPDADFNGDGVVNAIDLGQLRLQFFDVPGPSATVCTP